MCIDSNRDKRDRRRLVDDIVQLMGGQLCDENAEGPDKLSCHFKITYLKIIF